MGRLTRGLKLFFILNSTEHGIYAALKRSNANKSVGILTLLSRITTSSE